MILDSERETSHDVRGTSELRRPERSGDLEYSPSSEIQKGSGFPKHLSLGHSTGHSKSNTCSITRTYVRLYRTDDAHITRNVRNVSVM